MMSRFLARGRYGILLVPTIFLLLFFVYPLLSILWLSFSSTETSAVGTFSSILSSPYYQRVLRFTVIQAVISTIITVSLSIPVAYIFRKYSFRGKQALVTLSALPFVLPTVVVSVAFLALLGNDGLLNTLLVRVLNLPAGPVQIERSFSMILLAHIFYNLPLAFRLVYAFWANQSNRMEEAARTLGARRTQLWLHIWLPLLRPALLAAAVLVFIFTFTSFGVILILGGPRFATIEVEIYRQAISIFNLEAAAALSIIQIGAMAVLMVFYTRAQRIQAADLTRAESVARPPRRTADYFQVAMVLLILGLLLLTPLASLIFRAFWDSEHGTMTLRYFGMLSENSRGSILFVPPLEAVRNSLVFALATTITATTLGTLAAVILNSRAKITRWLDPLYMLPLATSAVTLGFGYIIALDEPPLNLRTSPWLTVIAHTLVAMPFVIRSVLPALRAIPERTREAAKTLGASDWQVFQTVDLPLIRRGIIVGATFAFTVSMGEFGATAFVARPEHPTLPVAIFRLLGQPGRSNYQQALALSVILLAVCALAFVILDRLRIPNSGEF